MTGAPVIHFADVSKSFRRSVVLAGVTLAIGEGERVALVGPNGAGKTTLIRCLLGEYVCDGVVEIGGVSPRAHRTEVLRRVGFVPQYPPPLKMPVGELVRFASALCGGDPAAVADEAAGLGLDIARFGSQPFAKLSGGQKQKLLIAIALRPHTDVLVMDEPAANLDPDARRSFFGRLAERQHATTMLISSHRLDEVSGLVGRVVELDHGRVTLDDRIAQAGAIDTVLRCRIALASGADAAVRALSEWRFSAIEDGAVFEGEVAGPDRLRFFGMLARYSALVREVRIEEFAHGRRPS